MHVQIPLAFFDVLFQNIHFNSSSLWPDDKINTFELINHLQTVRNIFMNFASIQVEAKNNNAFPDKCINLKSWEYLNLQMKNQNACWTNIENMKYCLSCGLTIQQARDDTVPMAVHIRMLFSYHL